MPYTDAYGRTISDDGRHVWDGYAWQPLAVPAPPAGLAPARPGRSIGGIVAAVAVISVLLVIGLGALAVYGLVRVPSYGNGYARSYQQQRADAEVLIRNDVAACESAPASCDRMKLRADIRRERSEVSGLKSFPFTPPCLQDEMKLQLQVLDQMYTFAQDVPGIGEAVITADLDKLRELRSGNPCPA